MCGKRSFPAVAEVILNGLAQVGRLNKAVGKIEQHSFDKFAAVGNIIDRIESVGAEKVGINFDAEAAAVRFNGTVDHLSVRKDHVIYHFIVT